MIDFNDFNLFSHLKTERQNTPPYITILNVVKTNGCRSDCIWDHNKRIRHTHTHSLDRKSQEGACNV